MMRSHNQLLRKNEEHEQGAVLVLVAISIIALLLVCALGVDYAYWLVHKRQLTHAAEAAALAGVAYMPNETDAENAAQDYATKNGFTNGTDGITVVVTPSGKDSLKVKITDPRTARFFSVLAGTQFTTTSGTGTATIGRPVMLGSPSNHIGTDKFFNSDPEGFWAGINGPCQPREDGDYYGSKYDFNMYGSTSGPSYTTYGCDGSNSGTGGWNAATSINQESVRDYTHTTYDPNGYFYLINIPGTGPTTTKWDLLAYDPSLGGKDTRTHLTDDLGYTQETRSRASTYIHEHGTTNDFYSNLETRFSLYTPSQTWGNPVDISSSTLIESHVYGPGEQPGQNGDTAVTINGTAMGDSTWSKIGSIPAGSDPGLYFVQVKVDNPTSARAYGRNFFSLMLTNNNGLYNCVNSTSNPNCPTIAAYDRLSVNYQLGTGTAAEFYLAQFAQEYAGRNVELEIWDPAEQMESIELLDEDSHSLGAAWDPQFRKATDSHGYDCPITVTDCKFNSTGSQMLVPVSGSQPTPMVPSVIMSATPGPLIPQPQLDNIGLYNRKRIVMKFTIPTSWTGGWIKVKYTPQTGPTAASTDRTTWTLKTTARPIRLIPN